MIRSATRSALAKNSRPSVRRISRPGQVSSSGCSCAQRPEHRGAALASERIDRRIVGLLGQREQRDDDRHQDALQGPEQHDARKRARGPHALGAAHAADCGELRRLDQLERVEHDDRGERGLRHERDDRPEQQQRRQRRRRGDELRHLRARARQAVDRGLRRAAAGRHRAEQAADDVGRAERQQLLVGAPAAARPGAPNARAAAMVSVKLMSAMPGRGWPHRCARCQLRQHQRRQPAGHADRRSPRRCRSRPKQRRCQRWPDAIATSGAGARGAKCSSPKRRANSASPSSSVGNDVSGSC